MTEAQEAIARALLREALDWVGMVNLTDAEEERAEEVAARIERLLVDLGELKRGRRHSYRQVAELEAELWPAG